MPATISAAQAARVSHSLQVRASCSCSCNEQLGTNHRPVPKSLFSKFHHRHLDTSRRHSMLLANWPHFTFYCSSSSSRCSAAIISQWHTQTNTMPPLHSVVSAASVALRGSCLEGTCKRRLTRTGRQLNRMSEAMGSRMRRAHLVTVGGRARAEARSHFVAQLAWWWPFASKATAATGRKLAPGTPIYVEQAKNVCVCVCVSFPLHLQDARQS